MSLQQAITACPNPKEDTTLTTHLRHETAQTKTVSKARAAAASADAAATKALLALVNHSLDEDKAEDIIAIDLAGKTSIADFMVVASGRSDRQVIAISQHLIERLKQDGFGPIRCEGMDQGNWVLIDAGDVIIHVFRPEVRAFYDLEKLWTVAIPEIGETA